MHSNKHFVSVLWISIFLCAATAVLSLCLGSICISPVGIIRELAGGGMTSNIIKYSRLPRTLACMTAGAGLASAGAVLQRVLANKLASPSIIGINAGAGLGVTICCALSVFSGWMLSLSAFFGSLITVALISAFSGKGGISKTTVILGGVALNSILNAASESITVLNPDVSIMTSEFRVGGFSSVSSSRLLPAANCAATWQTFLSSTESKEGSQWLTT
ncbi:MAG: iron chelate uptake ABC transporter family permease subunit [Clostridia bacterium]|nr:iron chelate uptake ABC transporter family permease subunit [Clostridia bacterium]